MGKRVLTFLLAMIMLFANLQPVLAVSTSKANKQWLVDNNYVEEEKNIKEKKEDSSSNGWAWGKIKPKKPKKPKKQISIDHIGSRTFEEGSQVIIPLFVRDNKGKQVKADLEVQGLPQALRLEKNTIIGKLEAIDWQGNQQEQEFNVVVIGSYKGAEARQEFTLIVKRQIREISIDLIGPRTFDEGSQVIIPLFVRNENQEKVKADLEVQGLPAGLSLENEAIVGSLEPMNWEENESQRVFDVVVTASFEGAEATENFTIAVRKTSSLLANILDVNLDERPDGSDKNGRELKVFGNPEFITREDGRKTVKFDGVDDGLRYTTDSQVYKAMNDNGFAFELYYRPLNLWKNGRDPIGNLQGSGFGFENSDGKLEIWAHINGGYHIIGDTIKNKEWVHVLGTYDKETLSFYVNGELKASKSVSGDLTEPPHFIFLGSDTDSSGNVQNPDNCEISIARVYSKGLSQEEVKKLYDSIDKIEEKPEVEEDDTVIIEEGTSTDSVRFGVISDIHTGPSRPRQSQRTKEALEFLANENAQTTFIVGDITDAGKEDEYRELKNVLDTSNTKDMTVHASMGNHEGGSRELFRKYIEDSENAHYKINGYHFIKVSPDGNQWGGYYDEISLWLRARLEVAKKDTGDKPIFVFFHHPIKDTFYVSEEWNGKMSKDVFKDYPMAVTFSGHIHSPNNHPRSIWQGEFTAVNTVSLYYFEMESGYGGSTYPPEQDKCSQGLLIDVEGSKVTIRNYDFISGTWIPQTWVFDTAKPNEFPYTDARYDQALAPEFEEDAQVTVSAEKRSAKLIFDQAKVAADDSLSDIVHSYEFTVYKKDDLSKIVHESKVWSNFHLIPMADTIEAEIVGLNPGVDYTMEITPVSAFKKKGTPLKVDFKTKGILGEQIPVTKIFDVDLDLREDGSEEFAREMKIFGNPDFQKRDGRTVVVLDGIDDGIRYSMNKEDYVKMNSDGFTVEMYYNPLGINDPGDPLGNTQSSGFCFENLNDGKNVEFWAHIGGGYKKVKFALESNKWSHVVASYDGSKIRVYVNGELVNSLIAFGPLKTPPHYLFLGGDTSGSGDLEYHSNCEFSMFRLYTGVMTDSEVKENFDKLNKFN